MQNSYDELWNVLNWAAPNCLGGRTEFMNFYTKPLKRARQISASKHVLGQVCCLAPWLHLPHSGLGKTPVLTAPGCMDHNDHSAWRLQGQKRQDMLHKKLQHHLLRRRKDDTIKEQMPKKLDHIVFCELSDLQLAAYRCDCVAIPGLCSRGDCCGRLHVANPDYRLPPPGP